MCASGKEILCLCIYSLDDIQLFSFSYKESAHPVPGQQLRIVHRIEINGLTQIGKSRSSEIVTVT